VVATYCRGIFYGILSFIWGCIVFNLIFVWVLWLFAFLYLNGDLKIVGWMFAFLAGATTISIGIGVGRRAFQEELQRYRDKQFRAANALYWEKRRAEMTPEERERILNALQKSHREYLEQQLKQQRANFIIVGHPEFKNSVNRALDELEAKVPNRFKQVLEYLPKAEYTTTILPNQGFSDGSFSIDGTGNYWDFRWVFLHEAGHNVLGHTKSNSLSHEQKEREANDYVANVLREMGFM